MVQHTHAKTVLCSAQCRKHPPDCSRVLRSSAPGYVDSVCLCQEADPVQVVHWDGLLLLSGLLHLAAPPVKQQLVQEHGNLLLQLLHTVLLEDEQLGGKGVPVQHKMLTSEHTADLQVVCQGGVEGCLVAEDVINSLAASSVQEFVPAQLVLLTLQALLWTMDPQKCAENASEGALRGKWLMVRAGNARGFCL